MNERIRKAGITIIGRYTGMGSAPVMLEYQGKVIERPPYNKCEEVILREFGLQLEPV